jgi:hypothetical protein
MRLRQRYKHLHAERIVCMAVARLRKDHGTPYADQVANARRINRTMVQLHAYVPVRKPTPAERLANAAWMRQGPPKQGA